MTGKQALKRLEFVDAIRYNEKLLKYPEGDSFPKETIEALDWAKFKIIVPNEKEKEKISMALKYLHDSDIDTDFVWVNQLVHSYMTDNNPQTIIVDDNLFNSIGEINGK